MIQSPKHVLDAVTAKSQVDCLERHKVLLPYFQADLFILIIVRDRIANHQQINIALAHQSDLLSLTGEPPLGDPKCGYDGLVLRRRSRHFRLLLCRRGRQDGCGETQRKADADAGYVIPNVNSLVSLSEYDCINNR